LDAIALIYDSRTSALINEAVNANPAAQASGRFHSFAIPLFSIEEMRPLQTLRRRNLARTRRRRPIAAIHQKYPLISCLAALSLARHHERVH